LKEFPAQLLAFPFLRDIEIKENPGANPIPDVALPKSLVKFECIDCGITALSPQWKLIPKLRLVMLGSNNLTSFPWSGQEVKEWFLKPGYKMFLRGNPICKESAYASTLACSSSYGCSDKCSPNNYKNRKCDLVCNTTSCEYDYGECLIKT
jgi:hypothetical protein